MDDSPEDYCLNTQKKGSATLFKTVIVSQDKIQKGFSIHLPSDRIHSYKT